MFNFFAITLEVPSEVSQAASQLGDPGFVGNLLAILIFFIIIFIYGFFLDRHNMIISLFSLYVGLLVIKLFPYETWQLGSWLEQWWGQLVFLTAVFVISVMILSASHLFRISYASNFLVRWWQATVSAVFFSGLFITIILTILPAEFLNQFSPGFLNLFISDTASFMWLILPIVGLLLVRHKRRGAGRPAY